MVQNFNLDSIIKVDFFERLRETSFQGTKKYERTTLREIPLYVEN